jgi:hypothetical protein
MVFKKTALVLGLLLIPVLISIACSNINAAANIAAIGEEFVLPVGQTVSISGEDIVIKFDSVITDSRSPAGVQTIWAGEAKCNLLITEKGELNQIVITENGLTNGYTLSSFGTHEISFKLLPYPQADSLPAAEDYELVITVS